MGNNAPFQATDTAITAFVLEINYPLVSVPHSASSSNWAQDRDVHITFLSLASTNTMPEMQCVQLLSYLLTYEAICSHPSPSPDLPLGWNVNVGSTSLYQTLRGNGTITWKQIHPCSREMPPHYYRRKSFYII